MTRKEAIKLKVGKSKIFIADHGIEEVYETTVVGVNLSTPSDPNSVLEIVGWCKRMPLWVYKPGEVHNTELEALRRLADTYTFKSDQNLNKRHAVCEKIARLKGGRDET